MFSNIQNLIMFRSVFHIQVALKTTGSLDTFRRSSGELEFNGSVPPLKNIRTVTHLQSVMFSWFYRTLTKIFAHIITQATAKRLNLLYFTAPWEIRTTPTLSACLHFPDGLLTTSKEEVETVSHHWHEVSWTSNNRYHVQQRWSVSDSDFFVVKPNEAIVHSLQNFDLPHRSRSRGRELKPRGALHSHSVAYCDFTILERVRRANRTVETKRTCTQQQGCVAFLWQCRSEGGSAITWHQCFHSETEKQKVSKCKLYLQ